MEPKSDAFKNGLKLDLKDINILKLLLNNYDSIYSLIKEYNKIDDLSRSTIVRRIKRMEKYGLISIIGTENEDVEDKRGAEKLSLTEYGIAHLIIKSEMLTDTEMSLLLEKAYQNEPYNVTFFSDYIDENVQNIINFVFKFIKIRINLDYFDVDYFKNQLKSATIMAYTNTIMKNAKKFTNMKLTKKEMKKIRRMKDYYLKESIKFFDQSIEFLNSKNKLYEQAKDILEKMKKGAQQALEL